MISGMQVGLFFRQAQTIRNLLAAADHWRRSSQPQGRKSGQRWPRLQRGRPRKNRGALQASRQVAPPRRRRTIVPRPPELSSRIHNFSAPPTIRVGFELTLQYLLVTFPQRENFSRALYSRRHGKPALWRSLLRRSSSPKASVNIVKDFRASSSPSETRESPRATSSASPRFFLPTAN